MEAKVKERFEQAQKLYEEEYEKYKNEVITWWDDTFSQGLGDMLKGLYRGFGDREVTIYVVNMDTDGYYCYYTFDLNFQTLSGCYRITHCDNKEKITTKFYEYDVSTLDKLKSCVEDLKKKKNDFEFFKEHTEEIVKAITTAYDDKVTKQNEDLDEIFDMLGQGTETTKRCKVTVEWI
jgi:hypothetical protein